MDITKTLFFGYVQVWMPSLSVQNITFMYPKLKFLFADQIIDQVSEVESPGTNNHVPLYVCHRPNRRLSLGQDDPTKHY
jgi:hypothetical protein